MATPSLTILLAVFALGGADPGKAEAQDAPKALIERAIKAHGGLDRLSKARSDRVRVKGMIQVAGRDVPFVAETVVQLPGQFRNSVTFQVEKRAFKVVQVVNGDEAYLTLDDQPQKVSESAVSEMRATLHRDRIVRLVPLLMDKNYGLESVAEAKVNERPALGVRVTYKGYRDVTLYFDKETALLVKTEHVLDHEGREVRQEELFSDFREIEGYRRPVKVTAFREGKKVMEGEMTHVKYEDKIDDSEFGKP